MSSVEWGRSDHESRVDRLADDIEDFVSAELGTIDVSAVGRDPDRWELVCRFFAGCAAAARAQGQTPAGGGGRIAEHIAARFGPFDGHDFATAGFDAFMDWLANADAYRPGALRAVLGDV
ncbi:MAG TPA: hypothetical protein VF796_26320 [Humisphaera sp.]